ncbi:MAG TPA: threonine synthase [Thermoanaerobaculia bacterium]|nr:threonine synthase [Thermoanaerobaculia bacterium]
MSPLLPKVTGLRCVLCAAVYAHGEVEYTCPRCGIEGILDVEYDHDLVARTFGREALAANRDLSLWRYRALLPVPDDAAALPPPRLQVGFTPVVESPVLAKELGLGAFFVKDDGRNPTASFKDRASSVGVLRARWLGRNEITCSSTGNAASSLAGFAAEAGMNAFIFVPATAPEAKVAQLLVYGAKVFLVEGPYEDAFRVCQAAVEEFGWYNRNCAINPYLVEGKKTCGLEIAEQMRERLPDVVTVALGDGCTTAGIWKGLLEMKTHGVVDRLPRILAVQAEGAAPLAMTFARGDERIDPVDAATLADSINVGAPRNGIKALRAVRASGGAIVTARDEAILAWIPRLARATGVFAEPTGVAALAGLEAALEKGLVRRGERVLHVATGNGLKDTRGAMRSVGPPTRIPPDLDAVRRALEKK